MAQMTELALQQADTCNGLKRIRFKLTKEDRQRLLEEAKKFTRTFEFELPQTIVLMDSSLDIDQALLQKYVEALSQPDIIVPARILHPIEFDKEFGHTYPFEVDWKTFPLVDTSLVKRERARELEEALERERQAFLEMKGSLLENPRFRGKFVAIYQGTIVGVDEDNRELAKRVYSQCGYVPIYIDKVERERRVFEMPSPEG